MAADEAWTGDYVVVESQDDWKTREARAVTPARRTPAPALRRVHALEPHSRFARRALEEELLRCRVIPVDHNDHLSRSGVIEQDRDRSFKKFDTTSGSGDHNADQFKRPLVRQVNQRRDHP
jgi:hypothetical protein